MNIPLTLQIRRMILLEPEHIWMQHWISPSDSAYRGEEDCKNLCGTAGCIAGHALALVNRKSLDGAREHYNIVCEASKALGLSYSEGSDLFIPWGKPYFNPIIEEAEKYVAGTKEYAERVVKLLDKAVKLYATEEEQNLYSMSISEE